MRTHVVFSWIDPHFAVLYARREEERLEEKLAARLRERVASEPPESAGAVEPDGACGQLDVL